MGEDTVTNATSTGAIVDQPTEGTADATISPPPGVPNAEFGPTDQDTPTSEAEADDQVSDGEDSQADEAGRWKHHAREWERRAKRNAELAARYPDLEARARSLEEQYEEAVGARARLEAELWRERAARAHGVPDDLFEFLTGSSEADVMERAERIAARVTGGPRRPLPDPTQGRGSPAPASPADAFAAYVRDSLNR